MSDDDIPMKEVKESPHDHVVPQSMNDFKLLKFKILVFPFS